MKRHTAWNNQEEERHRLTLEALADVDRGNVIDHNDVLTWAERLNFEEPLPPLGRSR